jgi:ribonuclease D
MSATDFLLVDDPRRYRRLVHELSERGTREIALDFEGESNLHVYGLHLCLVQVYDGERCYLVDPFALENPREISLITENPDVLKVMYDPSSDLSLLTNALGITVKNIFDLSSAAQVLGFRETSLTKVLSAELGVEPINKKKFQRANWYRRPLERTLLAYAASDVLHLLELKKVFLRRLVEQELFTDFMVQNFKVQDRDYRLDPETRYLRVKNAGRLTPSQQVYLKHFFAAREALARQLNWPPHNVLANELLIEIATSPPRDPSRWRELGRRRGKTVELRGFDEAQRTAKQELAALEHLPGRQSRSGRSGGASRRRGRRPRSG